MRVGSKTMKRWIASPTYMGRRCVDHELAIVERAKTSLLLNKPVYVGASVLDLSKLHMWSFWYDNLKAKYEESVQLCYTDTDSLVFLITSETEPKFTGEAGSMFDTSEHPKGPN